MSSNKKFDSIVYPAVITICKWIESDISNLQVKNSADRITEFSMRVTAIKDGTAYVRDSVNDKINSETVMVPVMICSEDGYGTDWCLQSYIKEIYFDAIPRWWPKSWLTTPDGEYADHIIINLGTIKRMLVPEIEVSCELSSKQNDPEFQNISFCELYAETDYNNNTEEEEMKKSLFTKIKDSKDTETKNDNVVINSEEKESFKSSLEENMDEKETREEIEEVVEAKGFDKKSFFIGMGVGVAIVATGVGAAVAAKKFGWFKKNEPVAETETK